MRKATHGILVTSAANYGLELFHLSTTIVQMHTGMHTHQVRQQSVPATSKPAATTM
jgi:hypothetical protein